MKTSVIRRDMFKNFWDKYSHKPDNSAMMLNNEADDELEALDRAEILQCLPDLTNKDAVDIGAGIGRFTTVLAQTARHVLSTDFIDSFITKNQERNGHLENIDYRVGDAVHLELNDRSVDLVFTNWLLMYLNDREVIDFVTNALRWLRPNGYLHLRESCSEPSTARSKGTLHDTSAVNPTSYRFSSLYIQLLRSIRFCDDENKLWKLDVLWSCSVQTYIQRHANWRQVHWVMRKVPVEVDDQSIVPSFDQLLDDFSYGWKEKQIKVDRMLDDRAMTWTDEIFADSELQNFLKKSTIFAFHPRQLAHHVYVNAHLLAEKYKCNIWAVETNPYYYRTSLTKANNSKDYRVQFSWTETFARAIDYWVEREGKFDAFLGTECVATNGIGIEKIRSIMRDGAEVILLEPIIAPATVASVIEILKQSEFKNVNAFNVTKRANDAIASYESTLPKENGTISRLLSSTITPIEWHLFVAQM